MTAALEGGEWSATRSGRAVPPGKTRYPFYGRLCGAPGPVWLGGKSHPHRDSIPDRPLRSQSLYRLSFAAQYQYTGLFEMIVGVLTVCHTKYTWDRSMCIFLFNPLTPNDPYSGRTAPLTSKRCILYIYSTNIGTEYFKHGIYSPFFSSSKCSLFLILTYLVPVLFTFYIQCVLKLKK
jgi:hypothetical protein